jgi:hypothetical protein
MQTTAKLHRTDLSSGETHQVLFASVFSAILMAAAGIHVVGAENPHEKHLSKTAPIYAADLKTNTDTNLLLLLQEEDFWVIDDEPVNHLARATEALNHHDAKTTASELRKTAFFVKAHAARAEGAAKADLQAAAAKLESLAGRVEQGVVKSRDELANTLARTYLILARYHYAAAVAAQAKHDIRAVKRDLTAAADYVENSLQSAGLAIDRATQTLLADARMAGNSVEAAPGKAEVDTGRALESLGKQIQKLGHKLETNTNQAHETAPNIGQQPDHK